MDTTGVFWCSPRWPHSIPCPEMGEGRPWSHYTYPQESVGYSEWADDVPWVTERSTQSRGRTDWSSWNSKTLAGLMVVWNGECHGAGGVCGGDDSFIENKPSKCRNELQTRSPVLETEERVKRNVRTWSPISMKKVPDGGFWRTSCRNHIWAPEQSPHSDTCRTDITGSECQRSRNRGWKPEHKNVSLFASPRHTHFLLNSMAKSPEQ